VLPCLVSKRVTLKMTADGLRITPAT